MTAGNRSGRRYLGPALMLVAVLLFTASSFGPARVAVAQLAPVSYEVTLAALIAFEWPFIAVRDGVIGQQQTNLELTVVETDARSAQALLGGSVDFAETSIDAIARADERGGDLVAIGGVVNKPPYALAVRPGINSYDDLRGRSIAVTDPRGGSTVVLKLLLGANGLRDDDYDMRPFGSTTNRYAALTNGAVDAAILGQPADFRRPLGAAAGTGPRLHRVPHPLPAPDAAGPGGVVPRPGLPRRRKVRPVLVAWSFLGSLKPDECYVRKLHPRLWLMDSHK